MNLETYSNETTGTGVLATADSAGAVNTAIFSRPHISRTGQMLFIMGDNKTHANLTKNPHASYLFLEDGSGYRGRRFSLIKRHEEINPDLVRELCRRCKESTDESSEKSRHIVYFDIERELPLIGGGNPAP